MEKLLQFILLAVFVLRLTCTYTSLNTMNTTKFSLLFDSKKEALLEAWNPKCNGLVIGLELFEIDLDEKTVKEIPIPEMPE